MANYGPCCICECEGESVQNFIQLDYKNPKKSTTSGWGCVVCGLPAEGALAIICDERLNNPDTVIDDIKFLMDGETGRVPVPAETDRVPHEHDLSLHRELDILN